MKLRGLEDCSSGATVASSTVKILTLRRDLISLGSSSICRSVRIYTRQQHPDSACKDNSRARLEPQITIGLAFALGHRTLTDRCRDTKPGSNLFEDAQSTGPKRRFVCWQTGECE